MNQTVVGQRSAGPGRCRPIAPFAAAGVLAFGLYALLPLSARAEDDLPAPAPEPAITVVAEAPVVALATMDGPQVAPARAAGFIEPIIAEPAPMAEPPAQRTAASAAAAAASADAFRATYADAVAEREVLRAANASLASQRNALGVVAALGVIALLMRLGRGDAAQPRCAAPATGRIGTASATARGSASDRIRFASDPVRVDRAPAHDRATHAAHDHAPVVGGR